MSENAHSDMCAQGRFRSVCPFAQSDQNLHWTFWVTNDVTFFSCGLMDARADLSVRLAHEEGRFSHVVAYSNAGGLMPLQRK